MRITNYILTALALALLPLSTALAQEKPAETALERPLTTEEKIDQLDQQIRVIQRLREIEKEEADKKTKEGSKATASAKDGFSIRSNDGDFAIRFKMLLQADSRTYIGDGSKQLTNTFLFRRIRPWFEGTVFKNIDFRLVPDFAGGQVALQEVFIRFNYWKEAQLTVGKFKSPVGLERLQPSSTLNFVESPLSTSFTPNYDLGVQLSGDLFDGAFQYQLAFVNGVADGASGDTDTNEDKDFAGRVFLFPFKATEIDAVQKLGVGIGGSWGDQGGNPKSPNTASYRSAGQATIFGYRNDGGANNTVYSAGSRYRIDPQGYWYYGPFGVQAEYVRSTQTLEIDMPPQKNRKFTHQAWQTAIVWVVTGEDASYGAVKPKTDFSLEAGTWGAFELEARYNEARFDKGVFPVFADATKSVSLAQGYAFGGTWYLNRFAKLQFNYEQTNFHGGGVGTPRENEKVLFSRVQVAF